MTHDIGPGGQFLNHKHTSRHFRENWTPELEDRLNHGAWVKQGSPAMRDRVHAKVLDLLESHVPEPLPVDLDARLCGLIDAAERDAG